MNTLSKIIAGHDAFHNDVSEELSERYKKLSSGQAPEILFITCSDSRVDPTTVTGAGPGELFVIRNAGNIVPVGRDESSEAGTLQYAVDVLGVKHIIVCGHSDCGAVKAMLSPDSVSGFSCISKYLATCSCACDLDAEKSILENVQTHALNQTKNLLEYDFVKQRCEDKELMLHAWVFDIGSASYSTYSGGKWTSVLEGQKDAASQSLTEQLLAG